MAMLAMTIMVHFWVVYWATGHLHPPLAPTCRTILQPSHLGHARPVGWQLWLLYGAFYVPSPRITPHMTMAMVTTAQTWGGGVKRQLKSVRFAASQTVQVGLAVAARINRYRKRLALKPAAIALQHALLWS